MNKAQKYIPFCGEELVDKLQDMIGDDSLKSIDVRKEYWGHFLTKCRAKATSKNTSQEEKILWIRSVLTTLEATYNLAEATNSYGVINLSAELFGIIESVFMQSCEPLCVTRIAMDLGLGSLINELILSPGTSENAPTKMVYYSEQMIDVFLGDTKVLFRKQLCINCPEKYCPHDIYWQLFMEEGVDNEKYSFSKEGDVNSGNLASVQFHKLEGNLARAQSYFEALYPKYVDAELKWRKDHVIATNPKAYLFAKALKEIFPEITIEEVGNYFRINNLRTYSSEARNRSASVNLFLNIFRNKGLKVPPSD